MELISRTINNRQTFVRPQATVLQACEAAGVDVPRFCYHEKLSVAGNCRRCLVEIQKSPKPVVACARPVAKGRVVYTDTPLVRKAREAVLEFLLINHPLDCPICDQGGECDLQDEALTYGADRGRFFEFKRSVEDKECGPIVKTIRTRCIHCTRCVRFSSEVAGNEVRGAFGRGEAREIGTYVHSFLRTELSGNLVDLCPVGALTSKPYAYQARSWELQRVDTLDFFDALGSDISVQTRKRTTTRPVSLKRRTVTQEEIVRILPRQNGLYAENWISDRTRYAFDGLKHSRLTQPRIRENSGNIQVTTWSESLFTITNRLYTASRNNSFSFIAGPQLNLESVYSIVTLAKRLGSNSVFQGYAPAQLNTDIPFFYSFNRKVQSLVENPRGGLILLNTNLRYEASLLNTILRREQNRRATSYVSVGAFSQLRYNHKHEGNSFRLLVASLENRLPYVKNRLQASNGSTGIFVGVETLRSHFAFFVQAIARSLGKLLFTKTSKEDRLGFVHSSIGSLAFAHQGVSSQPYVQAGASAFQFTFVKPAVSKSFYSRYIKNESTVTQVVSFDTHLDSFSADSKVSQLNTSHIYFPVTSLYERTGHLRVLEGQIRKHFKAVTPSSDRRSLEAIFSGLANVLGIAERFSWVESLSLFEDENPRAALLNNTPLPFAFNPFAFEVNTVSVAKLVPFHQTVRDFYLQEPIAANSPVRGECSLFLGTEGNFVRER